MKTKFHHGATGLWGFPDAKRRENLMAKALLKMARELGSDLKQPLCISSMGEFDLICPPGITYGERFAEYIKKHGARTGAIGYGYNMHTQGRDYWCMMNHFSAQKMLEEYFNQKKRHETKH